MGFSLYDATIPNFRQTLGAVAGLLNKAEAFSQEKAVAAEEIIQARLAADMLPFTYQVKSAAVHSIGAIEGLRKGVFSPDMTPPPGDFATLKSLIARTMASIEVIAFVIKLLSAAKSPGGGVISGEKTPLRSPSIAPIECTAADLT